MSFDALQVTKFFVVCAPPCKGLPKPWPVVYQGDSENDARSAVAEYTISSGPHSVPLVTPDLHTNYYGEPIGALANPVLYDNAYVSLHDLAKLCAQAGTPVDKDDMSVTAVMHAMKKAMGLRI